MNNPRHWYLKYCLGLRPAFTKPTLIFGGVIHEALEVFHRTEGDLNVAIEKFRAELEDRRAEYEDPEKYATDLARGPKMLDCWAVKWAETDALSFQNIYLEDEFTFKLGPNQGFEFTVRPDRVVREISTGLHYVLDYKTTGWSIGQTIQNAEQDDQLTSYLWAIKTLHPDWDLGGAYVDVIYNRQSVFKAERNAAPIHRSTWELKSFELQLVGLIAEVSQKYAALKDHPWQLLFRRHGLVDGIFGCDYESICRADVKPGDIPVGFVRDPWLNLDEILSNVPDFDIENWELKKEIVK